ncbi:MAG: LPS export ABC transporter ATP-binding protein [Candidatus Aminicenantaceae bacterium]
MPKDTPVSPLHEQQTLEGVRTVLRAKGLVKSFNRRTVVNGIDIEVRTGEVIAFLGRNGAGKTTTFHMIAGLQKPDSGSIHLDDSDISRYTSPQRAKVGITYLPQESSVFLKTSVENNLRMVLEFSGRKKKDVKKIAAELLKELGLSDLARQSAHSLSGGERRRLEICRALVLDPKFLLLDEPFTGIDPLTVVDLQKIIIRLRSRGIGIILSDHNVRDTLQITNRAYLIDEGEILIQGTPREVTADETARELFLGKGFRLGEEISAHSSEENR